MMGARKSVSPMPLDEQPDYSEVEVVLENCEQLVSDLTSAQQRYETLSEEDIAHFDRLALEAEAYVQNVCHGVLQAPVALHGGNVEDASDVFRLRKESVGCQLAYQLMKLAAAVGGWGVWPCSVPYEAATAAYIGYRDQQQADGMRDRKNAARIEKIRAKKLGVRKPSPMFEEARAAFEKIIARHPAITDARLLTRLEQFLAPGTDLPAERTLRRWRTGQ